MVASRPASHPRPEMDGAAGGAYGHHARTFDSTHSRAQLLVEAPTSCSLQPPASMCVMNAAMASQVVLLAEYAPRSAGSCRQRWQGLECQPVFDWAQGRAGGGSSQAAGSGLMCVLESSVLGGRMQAFSSHCCDSVLQTPAAAADFG